MIKYYVYIIKMFIKNNFTIETIQLHYFDLKNY